MYVDNTKECTQIIKVRRYKGTQVSRYVVTQVHRQLHRYTQIIVIGHDLMLLLSIAKWRNSLNSQLLVYDGDRQAPPDLSNLLPEGTDSDLDTWLTRHKSIPAFLRRNASASSNRRSFGSKRYFQRNLQICTRSNGFRIALYSPLTHVSCVALGTVEKDPFNQIYQITQKAR